MKKYLAVAAASARMLDGLYLPSLGSTDAPRRSIRLVTLSLKLIRAAIALSVVTAAAVSYASDVTVAIGGVTSLYPQVDTLKLSFNDSAGAVAVPYYLNGFVPSQATVGYFGTLRSTITDYHGPAYIAFNPENTVFYIFQECSLTVKCYLGLAFPTNAVRSTVDPLLSGHLASYFQENLRNITTLVGPNGGWNVAHNNLPNFSETFPFNEVVKPLNIIVSEASTPSAVPNPATAWLMLAGLGVVSSMSRRSKRRIN